MTTIESPLVPALVAPGMFLVQAGLAGGRDHALACLLALNGLRISEALNADIEHLVWNVATAP